MDELPPPSGTLGSAGWYPSPELPGRERYFDGARWTDAFRVQEHVLPPPAPPTPPTSTGYSPGWYPDPHRPGSQRYFDGTEWTSEYLIPAGAVESGKPHSRRTRATVLVVLVVLLFTARGIFVLNSGADDSDLATAPSSPDVERETATRDVAEPDAYGDDPALDALYDKCTDGDVDACRELYWDAPVGSRYEQYGKDRTLALGETTILPDSVDPAQVLDVLWETNLTEDDRQTICEGVDTYGLAVAGALLADSSGGMVTAEQGAAWLRTKC